MQILLVEDDATGAAFIKRALEEEGHHVEVVHDGETGLEAAAGRRHDLLILDGLLPGRDGSSVCRAVRRIDATVPILILSVRATVADKVAGLKSGADDYLTRPFALDELLARVEALGRRRAAATPLVVADLELDPVARRVRRDGRDIVLSNREYALLRYLMVNAGRVVSREKIAEQVWELEFDYGTNVVDVYVGYLRTKIDQGRAAKLIHTARGIGYCLREPRTKEAEPEA